VRWASQKKLESAMVERLFSAYFSEGRDIGDQATLAELATEAGLDRDDVLERLSLEAEFDEVREEAEAARREGITGVPFYVLGERFAVSGAQPVDVLSKAIARAAQPA